MGKCDKNQTSPKTMPPEDISPSVDYWSNIAADCVSNVGRTSAIAAVRLIDLVNQVSPLSAPGGVVLDVGAGTGAVTLAVAAHYPKTELVATDISPGMLDTISKRQLLNVSTVLGDARDLKNVISSHSGGRGGLTAFSHIFSTFVLQWMMDPVQAIRGVHHVMKPDGVLGIGIWGEQIDSYAVWERACKNLDPTSVIPDLFVDGAWRTPEQLENVLRELGFRDLKSETMMVPFEFMSAKEYATFWFEGKNPGAMKVIKAWKGDLKAVRAEVERIVQEDYDNGRSLALQVVLTTGKKVNDTSWI